jgi:predicted HicB family RNase H-like nuclease
MTITRASGKSIQDFLSRGRATQAEVDRLTNGAAHRLTLRIPAELHEQIEAARSSRPSRPTLTAWLLEAAEEKLRRSR